MKKIGLFYGPQGGATEKVANKVAEAFGSDNIELIPAKGAKAADVEKFDHVIYGLSTIGKDTWDMNNPAQDWANFLPETEKVNYDGKKVAIFGLGDHITYDLHFCDHIGVLAKKLMKVNATLVGQVDTDGYNFRESEAVIDGKFAGLPIDEDYEAEMTDERVTNWVEDLKKEFV